MTVWNKTGNSSWTEIKSIFNKTGSSSWTEILGVWVKTASSTWTRVFTRVLVPANTVEPSVTGSQYLYGTLTGTLGTWTSPNGTNSYARQWQRSTPSGSPIAPGSWSNISGATSSTYTTVDADNGKYIRLNVTATNLSGSSTAASYETLITKYSPVALSLYSLTGSSIVGATLTATEQIGTWKSTTTITGDTYPDTFEYQWSWSDGTVIQSTAFNSINSNTYTIVAGDLGKIIRVAVTGRTSAYLDDLNRGSGYATTGYTSSGTVTNTYAFNFGNTLYVGSNGYIGLDNGGSTAASPGSGRNINIYSNDLVQYKLQEYSDASNYYLYFRSYNYQSPLVRAAANAVDYQIKFYTDQAYCDIYIVRKGSSVPIQTQGPGYYSSGFTGYAGIPGPYFWGAGSVLRSYFNGSTGSQSAFTWTAIDATVWKDITNADIDDSFTSVLTSANQQAPVPTTPTALSAAYDAGQIVLTFSGGTGDQYDIYYSGTDTRPTDKQEFSDFPNVTSPYTATTLTTRDLTRYFWVRKSTGTLRSNWYPAAGGVVTRIPLFAPPVPNTPTTSGVSKTNITVSWTAGTATTTTDAGTSFEIYTSDTNSTPATTTSGTTKTSPASYTYTASASPATQYFWVRAVNKDANSAWSASVSATPTASKPPNNPSTPTAGTKTNTSIAWSWTAPSADSTHLAATGYDYVVDSSTSDPTGAGTAITAASVTTSSLTKNTDYYLHVRASNADGKSGWVTSAVATTNNDSFFTVTFDVNGSGGTAPASVTQATAGGSVTLAAAITRTGYTFGGWNTNTSGTGTNSTAGTSYTPTADITLYAKWTVAYAAVVWGSMPNPAFARNTTPASSSTSYRWGWNNQTPSSGDYTASGITWEWQRSTADTDTSQSASPTGFISGGTRPRRTGGGLTVGGSSYDNRVSSLSSDYNTTTNTAGANEPVGFSTQPRYLRYRAVVTGSDGNVYRSNYSGWV